MNEVNATGVTEREHAVILSLRQCGIGRSVMTTVFQRMALPWIAVIAIASMPAMAENKPSMKVLNEITLDIDNDGKADRAALVEDPESVGADLYIYLGGGDEKLDLSKKPGFLKKDLADGLILGFESRVKGSLIVKYGCGGCSNDHETTLTIVHRDGDFLVAGFTYAWDTRNEGIGGCDINFLSGKGVSSRGLGKSKPIQAKFKPIRLAEWSEHKHPKACHF